MSAPAGSSPHKRGAFAAEGRGKEVAPVAFDVSGALGAPAAGDGQSAVVEDSGDTTTGVQHATGVQKPPKGPIKCGACGQPKKGHTCSHRAGDHKWNELCVKCGGGGKSVCVNCGHAGGGGGAGTSKRAPAAGTAAAATSHKKAMQEFLDRQQTSAPLELEAFKTELFAELAALGVECCRDRKALTAGLHAFDDKFQHKHTDPMLAEWRTNFSDELVGPDTADARFAQLDEELGAELGAEVDCAEGGHAGSAGGGAGGGVRMRSMII